MMIRRRLRSYVVKRLLHVLPNARINGRTMFALDLVQALPGYTHTVVVLDEPENSDQALTWSMLAAGAVVLHGKEYRHSDEHDEYAAALIYGADSSRLSLPPRIPRICYAYHGFDAGEGYDLVLFPSEYAMGSGPRSFECEVLAPAIKVRTLRRLGAVKDPRFSVGLFSSGEEGKYPIGLIMHLAKKLPSDIRLIVTQHPAIKPLAGGGIWSVPAMPESTLKGIYMSNVVVYANAPEYCTGYGRTCMEALAARRPVVCERRGAPGELLRDGVHALMFDGYDQAVDGILYLRKERSAADKLAATGQVLASWHDISNHVATLKGILHSMGA